MIIFNKTFIPTEKCMNDESSKHTKPVAKRITAYFIYIIKYADAFSLNPYLKTAYGSYQVFVNAREIAVANKMPNNPQSFPSQIEKTKFKAAVTINK